MSPYFLGVLADYFSSLVLSRLSRSPLRRAVFPISVRLLAGVNLCVNNVITPISLPLFPPVRSTVPLSRNRGSTTRTIESKHKDKVLYRGIGGVQEEYKEAYNNGGIFWKGRIFYNVYK